MSRIQIPIDKGWMPDAQPWEMPPGGLIDCKNVYRYNGLWYPLQNTNMSLTATDTWLGCALGVRDAANAQEDTYIFIADVYSASGAGATRKLWRVKYDRLNSRLTDETDVSKSGYTYNVQNGKFLYYGGTSAWVLFFTGGTEIQKITDIDGAAQDFEALGGSPDAGEWGCFFKGHLISGFLHDSGTGATSPQTVAISANGDIETWSDTFDLNTGASKESFPDAWGWITGLESMQDSFAVFFQNSISLGYFTGYPSWISFKKEIIKGIGALPNSIISIGGSIFFWGKNDVYVLEGNGNCYGIGTGRVRNRLCIPQRSEWNEFPLITTFHWSEKKTIMWCYCDVSLRGEPRPTNILCYNYEEKVFSVIEDVNCHALFSVYDLYGHEQLGGLIRSGGTEYVRLFDGTMRTATLTTGDFTLDENVMFINEVRPKVRKDTTTNLLTNGTFETGDHTGWTHDSNATWTVEGSGAYAGTYCLKVVAGATDSDFTSSNIAASEFEDFLLECYIKTTGAVTTTRILLKLECYDSTPTSLGEMIVAIISYNTASSWVKLSGIGRSFQNTAYVAAQIECEDGTGTWYIDSISLARTNVAGTVQVRVGTRMSPSDTVSYTTAKDMDSDGKCDVRATGRYARFELTADGPIGSNMSANIQEAGKR